MQKFDTNLLQNLKWMQNNAPNITSLVQKKSDWYERYQDQFWTDWYNNIFNIDTCDAMGIYIWCDILCIPRDFVDLSNYEHNWAFGPTRDNFEGADNIGGNFFGAGGKVVKNIEEARILLKLRYLTLTSDGRIESINRMLKWIFNRGEAWDYSSSRYAYVTDNTQGAVSSSESTNGSFLLYDWQGSTEIQHDYKQILLSHGNNAGLAINGVSGTVSRMAHPDWYSWGNGSGTGLVGGDTRQYGGPDYYGQLCGDYPGEAIENFANAVRVIKTASSGEPVYSLANNPSAKSISLPSQAGVNVCYSFYIKVLSENVASVSVTENSDASSNGKLFDPVTGQFNLDPSLSYFIKGKFDGVRRESNRGGIKAIGGDWYRIWIVEQTATAASGVSTSFSIELKATAAGSTQTRELPEGSDALLFGYSICVCDPVQNPNGPEPYFYGTQNPPSDGTAILSVTAGTLNNISCANGPLTTRNGVVGESFMQPGSSLAYSGSIGGYPYPGNATLIAETDGIRRSWNVSRLDGVPPPPTADYYMEYVIGPYFANNLSDNFKTLVGDRNEGFLPANAGIRWQLYQEVADLSDIDLTVSDITDTRVGFETEGVAWINTDGIIRVGGINEWPLNNFNGVIRQLESLKGVNQVVDGALVNDYSISKASRDDFGREIPRAAITNYWRYTQPNDGTSFGNIIEDGANTVTATPISGVPNQFPSFKLSATIGTVPTSGYARAVLATKYTGTLTGPLSFIAIVKNNTVNGQKLFVTVPDGMGGYIPKFYNIGVGDLQRIEIDLAAEIVAGATWDGSTGGISIGLISGKDLPTEVGTTLELDILSLMLVSGSTMNALAISTSEDFAKKTATSIYIKNPGSLATGVQLIASNGDVVATVNFPRSAAGGYVSSMNITDLTGDWASTLLSKIKYIV